MQIVTAIEKNEEQIEGNWAHPREARKCVLSTLSGKH